MLQITTHQLVSKREKHETTISNIEKYYTGSRKRAGELINKDFGSPELSTNAGRDVKKERRMLLIVHSSCNSEGQLGIDRIRLDEPKFQKTWRPSKEPPSRNRKYPPQLLLLR
jgi:hypothetical protein